MTGLCCDNSSHVGIRTCPQAAYTGGNESLQVRQSAEWEWWDGQRDFVAKPEERPKDDWKSNSYGDKMANGRDLYAIVDVVPPKQGSIMVSLYFKKLGISTALGHYNDDSHHLSYRHSWRKREDAAAKLTKPVHSLLPQQENASKRPPAPDLG